MVLLTFQQDFFKFLPFLTINYWHSDQYLQNMRNPADWVNFQTPDS